jgi:hypothetical protein
VLRGAYCVVREWTGTPCEGWIGEYSIDIESFARLGGRIFRNPRSVILSAPTNDTESCLFTVMPERFYRASIFLPLTNGADRINGFPPKACGNDSPCVILHRTALFACCGVTQNDNRIWMYNPICNERKIIWMKIIKGGSLTVALSA